jgi:signal transduction histidine kinase
MDIEEPLTLDEPERAHVRLRCTQEIITNAVRHAGARNLWIDARRVDGGIAIEARDDGTGTEALIPGNGLRGMRERLAQHGGDLQVESTPGAGFRLRLALPATMLGVPLGNIAAASGSNPSQPPPTPGETTPEGATAS